VAKGRQGADGLMADIHGRDSVNRRSTWGMADEVLLLLLLLLPLPLLLPCRSCSSAYSAAALLLLLLLLLLCSKFQDPINPQAAPYRQACAHPLSLQSLLCPWSQPCTHHPSTTSTSSRCTTTPGPRCCALPTCHPLPP
jgi:hypothetical protein